MDTQTVVTLVIIAVAALVLVAAAFVAVRSRRTTRLRDEFGSEYDRTLDSSGGRGKAERELAARKQEHQQLELRVLSPAARERYVQAWTRVQATFVDAPVTALNEADGLVTQLMAERGYPTDDLENQARLLSVEHAPVLDSFRAAHEVELKSRSQQASTEEVRNAMLDLRSVFESLVSTGAEAEPYPADREQAPDRQARPIV